MMASYRPALSVFRGYNRGEIAEFWFEKFEHYVKDSNLSSNEAIVMFRCHLDEDAIVWFLTLDEGVKRSLKELKTSFFANFSKFHIRPVGLKMEMTSRVQAPDESIEHYFWDKRSLLLQCCITDEEEVVEHLISGFIPIIRESFETRSVKTCEELKRHAWEIYDKIAIPSGKTGRYKSDHNDIDVDVTGVTGGNVDGNVNMGGIVHGDVGSTVYYYVYLVVSQDEGQRLISGHKFEQLNDQIKDLLRNPGNDDVNTAAGLFQRSETDDEGALEDIGKRPTLDEESALQDVKKRPILDDEGRLQDIQKRPTLDEEGALQDVWKSQEVDEESDEDFQGTDFKEPDPTSPCSSHDVIDRTLWVPDNKAEYCMVCETTKFNIIHRKHHCRRCGKLICDKCSVTKLPQTIEHYKRVCTRCISFSPIAEDGFYA